MIKKRTTFLFTVPNFAEFFHPPPSAVGGENKNNKNALNSAATYHIF